MVSKTPDMFNNLCRARVGSAGLDVGCRVGSLKARHKTPCKGVV